MYYVIRTPQGSYYMGPFEDRACDLFTNKVERAKPFTTEAKAAEEQADRWMLHDAKIIPIEGDPSHGAP